MIDYSVDALMEKTKNKYVLSQVIAKRAREIRSEEGFVLGYKAIDQAAQELIDEKYTYTFDREEHNGDEE